MNLCRQTIIRAVHPTAIFQDVMPPHKAENCLPKKDIDVSWDSSRLNPKNRIDSLDPVRDPKWRIDGCGSLGRQFYTIPLFLSELNPMRIDTIIPEVSDQFFELWELLELDSAFHYKDSRVVRLGISQHILRTLEFWTRTIPDFEKFYHSLPFGSHIVIQNLAKDIQQIKVEVAKAHYLEPRLLSQQQLESRWNFGSISWPRLLEIQQIKFIRQLHDTVSLVDIPTSDGSHTCIFKAQNSSPKFTYHELKVLLTLPPHPNIIGRPLHVVINRCRWGAKKGIVGFTLPYHAQGSLRDILPTRRLRGTLLLRDQIKWAIQLTSAMLHINKHGCHYSDLRLDNILLSDSDDLIMVDFEQRGVWCGFSAPEVSFLDYVYMLATYDNAPPEARSHFNILLDRFVPNWRSCQGELYSNPDHGYSVPWLGLSDEEKESAQSYMLGRVLWCLFEGCSSPERAVWQSYQNEDSLEFPKFEKTPAEIMVLIQDCANGAEECRRRNNGGVMRKGNRLLVRDGKNIDTADTVQDEATRWWKKEITEATEFLEARERRKARGDFESVYKRPNLSEILQSLMAFKGVSSK